MQQQNPSHDLPQQLLTKKQQVELRMLRDSLVRDKKAVDSFVEEAVPPALLSILKQQVQDLERQIQEMQKKAAELPAQSRAELKNLEWLYKNLPSLQSVKYWQLLQILLQFPPRLQIGIDKELAEYISKFPVVQELKKRIPIHKYVGMSLRQFLTDVIAFWRLRSLQLYEISHLKENESPIEKSLALEQEFAIIPHVNHHLLVEKRLGGNDAVGIFKAMDLGSNIPVVVKYLTQRPEPSLTDSQIRTMNTAELRKRFEREAQAFEKLEKHRRAKEVEMAQLIENAKARIEEGKRENNYDKMRAGFDLLKRGEELLCDRFFIKTYFLATGQIYRFGITDDGFERKPEGENVAFMVMEYLNDSKTLEELIEEHRQQKKFIPLATCITMMEGILQSLHYCHTEGIIHRDIRPANILLTKDNKVRLTNLGLARVEDMTQLTAQGVFIGTPGYAAPEGIVQGIKYQKDFEHLIGATDGRFDLYSLGCVAYEMLTNKQPFSSGKTNLAEHDQEILLKHLQEEPMSPSRLRPEIPARLNFIILKLLSKKADNRFATANETLDALRASMSLGQKAGEFTHKMFDKMRTEPAEKVFPEPRRRSRRSLVLAAACLVMAIAGGVGWYAYGPWWQPVFTQGKVWFDVYVRRIDPLAAEKAKVAGQIEEISVARQNLEKMWEHANELCVTLRKEFPSDEGYPTPSVRVDTLLLKAKRDILGMAMMIREARDRSEKESPTALLQWLETAKQQAASGQTEALLNRTLNQLRAVENVARQMKQVRNDEDSTRKVARTLRTYIFSAEEKATLLDEKIALCQERFTAEQGYPQIPPKVLENLQVLRRQAQEFVQVVTDITKALAEDKLGEAKKLALPHRQFSLDALEQFGDIAESIGEVIKSGENIYRDRTRKRTMDRAFLILQDRLKLLQQYLPIAKEDATKLAEAFPGEKPPQELFQKSQQEIKQLQATTNQLSQYVQESKEDKALALADSVVKTGLPTVSEELRQFHERALDKIKIAQAKGKEQVYKKEIADLLSLTKKSLANLNSAYQSWQQESGTLRKESPKDPLVANDRTTKISQRSEKTQQTLISLLESVEKKINESDLQTAYQLLSQNKDKSAAAQKVAQLLGIEGQKTRDALAMARSSQQVQQDKERCQRTLQKLDKYVTGRTELIRPLFKEISALQKEFPTNQHYPQVGDRSREILGKAQQWIGFYQKESDKAKQLLDQRQIAQAIEVLQPFENKGLEYADFPKDMQAVQDDLAKVREDGRKFKVHQEKSAKVEQYLSDLSNRSQALQANLTAMDSIVEQLRPYASKTGYMRPDPNMAKYQEEARLEVSQLQSLMSDARQMLDQKRYQDSLSLLEPYSETVNAGISRLPMIKSYHEQLKKILQNNQQLERNPAMRQELLRRQEAETQRKARLQQWRKAPGRWYDEVMAIKRQYDELQAGIERSLQEKGSSLVYARINSNWIKIQEYAEQMAELQELIEILQKKKIALPTEPSSHREKQLISYLETRTINISVQEAQLALMQTLQKIASEVQKGGWVEEETLRTLLRSLEAIAREFDEAYIPIKSQLITRSEQ